MPAIMPPVASLLLVVPMLVPQLPEAPRGLQTLAVMLVLQMPAAMLVSLTSPRWADSVAWAAQEAPTQVDRLQAALIPAALIPARVVLTLV
jgi:hypothetical protein